MLTYLVVRKDIHLNGRISKSVVICSRSKDKAEAEKERLMKERILGKDYCWYEVVECPMC